MKTRNIFWWVLFFSSAIWMQTLIPGVDLLAVGVIIALQEQRYTQLFWVVLLCVLVHEGIGTLDFGASILWYSVIAIFFFLGCWLFESANILFVFLLSACMGGAHYVIIRAMSALQYIPVDETRLLDESSLQGLLVPFVWMLASKTRSWMVLHGHTA